MLDEKTMPYTIAAAVMSIILIAFLKTSAPKKATAKAAISRAVLTSY